MTKSLYPVLDLEQFYKIYDKFRALDDNLELLGVRLCILSDNFIIFLRIWVSDPVPVTSQVLAGEPVEEKMKLLINFIQTS